MGSLLLSFEASICRAVGLTELLDTVETSVGRHVVRMLFDGGFHDLCSRNGAKVTLMVTPKENQLTRIGMIKESQEKAKSTCMQVLTVTCESLDIARRRC